MRKIYTAIIILVFTHFFKVSAQNNSFPVSGSVGIGTTTPAEKLELSSAGDVGIRLFNTTANTWDIKNTTNGKLDFIRGTNNLHMRIDQFGNVGIGTALPAYKLDVVGNSFFFGSHTNNTIPTSLNVTAGVNANAMINFGWYSSFDATIWQIGRNASDQSFRISNWSSGNEANSITALSNGNVGIGTTNPTAKLRVAGDIYADLRLSFQDNARFNVTNTDVTTLNTTTFSMPHYGVAAPSAGSAADLWISGNQAIRMFTAGNPKPTMNIISGNVGIGITNPTELLTLNVPNVANTKLIKFLTNGVNNYGDLSVQSNELRLSSPFGVGIAPNNVVSAYFATNGNVGIGTTNPQAKLEIGGSYAQSNPLLAVRSNNGNDIEFGHANQAGYGSVLGHNMSNGMPFLAFNAEAGTNINTYRTRGINGILLYSDLAGGLRFGTLPNGNADNQTVNDRLYINNGGNVGIGTTNPQERLVVEGAGIFKGGTTATVIRNDNHSGGRTYLAMDGNSENGIASGSDYLLFEKYTSGEANIINPNGNLNFWTTATNDVKIYTTNNINTTFKSNGQVVIGNPSTLPTDYKLLVAGNIIAEKVKVKKQSSGWPDFVFAPSYKLPSLAEVESFVKKNSHLPEIPSATEIEKDGQDLGEMNRLLLKKVEELTLYMIELKKENEKQNVEIEKLKAVKK